MVESGILFSAVDDLLVVPKEGTYANDPSTFDMLHTPVRNGAFFIFLGKIVELRG